MPVAPPSRAKKTPRTAPTGRKALSPNWAEQGIALLMARSDSLAETRPRVIEMVCCAMGWPGGIYWELAGVPATLHRAATWSAAGSGLEAVLALDRHGPVPAAGSAIRRACDTGEEAVDDLSHADGMALHPGTHAAGLRSTIAMPIHADARVIGVMECFSATPVVPEARLRQRLQGVGRHIGQFLQRKQTEHELWRFRTALDMSTDEIYLTDRATMRFVDVNATACAVKSRTRAELLTLGPQDVWHTGREQLEAIFDAAIKAGPAGVKLRGGLKDGDYRLVLDVHHLALCSGDNWIILTTARDITQRVRAEDSAQRLGQMFAALSATNEAIMRAESPESLYQQVCDAAVDGGQFLTAAILLPDPRTAAVVILAVAGPNEQQLRKVRISVDPASPEGQGLVGTAFNTRRSCVSNKFLSDERTRPWHAQAERAGIASGAAVPLIRDGHSMGVLLFYSCQKHTFDDEVVKLLVRMAANVVFALENFEHEAERRRGRARIDYLASHDALTGLPNRAMFNEVLNVTIQTALRYQRMFAVMFIDLDRFKLINDSLGHDAGDQLLQEMSARLKNCLRASDVVARLGGDEFVVLVQELGEPDAIAAVARKILAAAMKPFALLGQECRVTASIGISMYPADAQDEPTLMKNADIAMYAAKEEGKNNFQFYSAEIQSQSLERLTLETCLRRALERNEFSLHYQAKVDLKTGSINGVEALLRWHSPELGQVSPAQLIPIAEETGLIVAIGKWVLKTACAQNMAWQRQGLPPVCMAVNLSARQFSDPFLLQDIADVLCDTGMQPRLLELEITEGMVIQHPGKAIKLLTAIKALGVRLAIDDFGTGYSSLGQLKQFPIDTLKVDRSFIHDIHHDGEDRAITEAIIAMGKTLSLTVVAEGVETIEQETFLREHACDEMQGYYFSKPVIADQFAELLRGQGLPVPDPANLLPADEEARLHGVLALHPRSGGACTGKRPVRTCPPTRPD
jgi:diguanylate cyclase (GGDEF)-like protein